LTEFGNPGRAPSPISALPPRLSSEASPKAISGRTSYLRVRLAFHPYPHLIPWFFNTSGFGPPAGITLPSPWTWVAHPVSGRRRCTHAPCSDSLSLRLRPLRLNLAHHRHSPVHSTKGTPSRVKPAPTACRHTVSGTLSLPSRGAFHLSLTVLVHYRSPGSI
jgi:hypothetical protein